jgi:hypothetical protein
MAIKKSDLYSSRLGSCDEQHCGMDASQYTDYFLYIKHNSSPCCNADGKSQ